MRHVHSGDSGISADFNITSNFLNYKYFAEYLLGNLMPIPDCINVHIVGACGIGHQVDFRELCLKGQRHGQSPTNTI